MTDHPTRNPIRSPEALAEFLLDVRDAIPDDQDEGLVILYRSELRLLVSAILGETDIEETAQPRSVVRNSDHPATQVAEKHQRPPQGDCGALHQTTAVPPGWVHGGERIRKLSDGLWVPTDLPMAPPPDHRTAHGYPVYTATGAAPGLEGYRGDEGSRGGRLTGIGFMGSTVEDMRGRGETKASPPPVPPSSPSRSGSLSCAPGFGIAGSRTGRTGSTDPFAPEDARRSASKEVDRDSPGKDR